MFEYFPPESIYFVCNAVLYIITLFFFIRKKKYSVGTFLMSIYTVSAVFAIFYYGVFVLIDNSDKLNVWSFIFLYICLMIGFWPLVKMKDVDAILVGNLEYRSFILICYIVILLSIEPFLENVRLIFTPHDAFEAHNDAVEGELYIYSFVASRLNSYCILFRSFVPLATILAFKIRKIPVFLKYLLLIPTMNYILIGYNTGIRGNIISYMAMFLCMIIFLNPIFSKTQKKYIKKASFLVGTIILLLFVAISSSRYEGNTSSSKSTMDVWLLQYLSEGPVLFNAQIWEKTPDTNGDVNFHFYKKQLGMKTYVTYREREEHYLGKNGLRIEVFRTYVGDFLTDMGKVGTFLFCCIISFFVLRMNRGNSLTISSLLFYSNILELYVIGFASNIYRDYSTSKGFFCMMMLAFLFYFLRRLNKDYILITK